MFGALLWLWCVVLYFAATVYGDNGTEFEVNYEVNSSYIYVLTPIDFVYAAPGISRTMISCIVFIFVHSLKESLQGTSHQPKGIKEKPICIIKKSDRLVVEIVVIVVASLVGYALTLVGIARLIDKVHDFNFHGKVVVFSDLGDGSM